MRELKTGSSDPYQRLPRSSWFEDSIFDRRKEKGASPLTNQLRDPPLSYERNYLQANH